MTTRARKHYYIANLAHIEDCKWAQAPEDLGVEIYNPLTWEPPFKDEFNCFKTKREAQAALKKIKDALWGR